MPHPAPTIRKTPNFDFIFGRYSISNTIIPYFQINLSFNDAAKTLRLVNELPGAAAFEWKIEELFQRDIDWGRVEKRIVPYLKQSDQPQFFNALTIALLPVRSDVIGCFNVDENWSAPTLDNELGIIEHGVAYSFGPIRCGYWQNWISPEEDGARIGQLCWNTEQICGVAIDGQHRLAAIKQLVGAGSDQFRAASVPVILIVLDPKLGFKHGSDRETLLDTLRKLFIDLNKHAQKVSRARQILLDDRDPASICVRTLIGERLLGGAAELDGPSPRIPLSLVDWHSEQAKFDEGPYLTTILGTDWAVAKILGIKPMEDSMAFDQISKLLSLLESKLGIELQEAKARLLDCRKFDRPFSFLGDQDESELSVIADGFRSRWVPAVVSLFTCFVPYHELIQLRQNSGTLCPEFCNWFALTASAESGGGEAVRIQSNFERNITGRAQDPVSVSEFKELVYECEELKGKRQLAFTVVFQRALVLTFIHATTITNEMINAAVDPIDMDLDDIGNEIDEDNEELNDPSEDSSTAAEIGQQGYGTLDSSRWVVDALNELVGRWPEVLSVFAEFEVMEGGGHEHFWLCSFLQPAGTIDFTQQASIRSADLLSLAVIFWIYHAREGLQVEDFEALIARSTKATSGLDLKLRRCLSRMSQNENSIGGRIMRARTSDAGDADTRWSAVEPRVRHLWNVLAA